MTKALKNLLLVLLALCMSVCIGLFAVACNSDDDKEPNHKTDQDGEGEGEGEEEEEEEESGETYTVTLDAGDGSLEDGVASTYTTKTNGKLSGYLPVPEISTKDWGFFGWYTAAEGGTAIDETTHVFTENVTLYAHYGRVNGVWNKDGSELIASLSRNTGETTGIQYWLGDGVKIDLEEGDEISLYMNGELVTFNVHASYASSCIENANDTTTKVTSVTVSEDANFAIYLWDYASGNSEFWSCQFFGTATSIPTTSTIPTGCEQIKVTGTNGTATIYLVVNGVAVNSSNGANYQIHGWQTGNTALFGAWGSTPTLEKEITVEADLLDDLTLMFYWNGGQSGNVSNIKVDGTYIVKISTLSGSTVSVKEFDENGPEDTDEEDVKTPVVDGYYIAGSFNSWGFNLDYYIDETEGLTLDLDKGATFQAVICTSEAGAIDWRYAAKDSFYQMATGKEEGYCAVNGNNMEVLTAGKYTITVDTTGDTPVFIITPEAGLDADTTVFIIHYYIKGATVTGWANKTDSEYEMTNNDGIYTLEIHLEANDEFMFWAQAEHPETHDYSASNAMIQSGALAADVTCVTVTGSNMKTVAAGTYTFTFNSETGKLNVEFVAD